MAELGCTACAEPFEDTKTKEFIELTRLAESAREALRLLGSANCTHPRAAGGQLHHHNMFNEPSLPTWSTTLL